MSVKAMDCATKLSAEKAKALYAAGIRLIGRYIGSPSSWKTLELAEVKALKDAGIKIYSIRQTTNNVASFFNYAKGVTEAKEAETWAHSINQPNGTAVYFSVDFDAKGSALDAVKQFFKGVAVTLKDYKVGVYGSYGVVEALSETTYTDYYFQTYAWSGGKVSKYADLFQYKNGQAIAGVTVDYNEIKDDAGEWGVVASKVDKPKTVSSVKKKKQTVPDPYIVKSGDTLSEIGARYGVAYQDIKLWNDLKSDFILPGQKLKMKKAAPVKSEPTKSGSSVVPYPGYLIRNGSTGKDVERIQRALGINVDGIFGKQTEAAVKAYQKRHSLSIDGIVGKETWNTLF
jgi:LysM repeat protein